MNDFAFGRLVTLNVVKLLLENSDRNIDLNTSNTLVSLINVHTLDYLINVPDLLSVPADKFPKIPVRLLDRE